jgi:cytochrome c553
MRVLSGFAGLISLVYACTGAAAAPAPAAKADLERGKQIASTVCASCHGADGNSPLAANPVLAGQHGGYIATQLANFKSGARPSPVMQAMAAALSPEDMVNVGAYFETQKPAPRMARDKAAVARGQQIWRTGNKAMGIPACASCHGAAGHGIPAQYPRLANQHPELTLGWLQAYASGARPSPVMGPIASKLSDNDMKAVTDYVTGLR